MTCAGCRWWVYQFDRGPIRHGDCRRHAPIISRPGMVADSPVGKWPVTREDAWCGSHKPAQEAA